MHLYEIFLFTFSFYYYSDIRTYDRRSWGILCHTTCISASILTLKHLVLMLTSLFLRCLTIEDKWCRWFDPHLGVDHVGSARLLGAALASHHLGYMGRLIGPWGEINHLKRKGEIIIYNMVKMELELMSSDVIWTDATHVISLFFSVTWTISFLGHRIQFFVALVKHTHTPLQSGCAPCGLQRACWLAECPGGCAPFVYVVSALRWAPCTLTGDVTVTLHPCWPGGWPAAPSSPAPRQPSEKEDAP